MRRALAIAVLFALALAIAVLLALLAGCATTITRGPRSCATPFDRERAHRATFGLVRLWGWSGGIRGEPSVGWATAVAIGPRTVLTAGHCLERSACCLDDEKTYAGCVGYQLARSDTPGGIVLHAVDYAPGDYRAAVLRTDRRLGSWLEVGDPREGWAIVCTLVGDYNVRLEAPPGRRFWGWRPFRGASGAPIVQDGRVVGVLRSQAICENIEHAMLWKILGQRPFLCACKVADRGEYEPVGPLEGCR